MENKALWLDGPGIPPRIGPAAIPKPAEGQLLIRTKAVAVQPGEWKIQAGVIPIPLTYPTVIGLSLSGVVEKIGPGVIRFSPGDRVASNTTGVIRDDHQFGAYQRFSLVPQELTSKISNATFEDAASLSTVYACMSALFIHLKLDRPLSSSEAVTKNEKVLVWGVSSSFGAFSAQLAHQAGYTVVGVASERHERLSKTLGVSYFVNRASSQTVKELIALGPFKAVLAAADSADDQAKIGEVLAAHGGGRFLSTMGLRDGVKLPDGVTGFFQQFLDDFLDPKNKDFTQWVWWDYLEAAFANGRLKSILLETRGGLSQVSGAWGLLKEGKVNGARLIIDPGLD